MFGLTATVPAVAHPPTGVPIADLTHRIADHPDDPALYLARGDLRRIDGDLAGARADYAEVERLDPSHPRLPCSRATLALDAGEPVLARRILDAALAARPADARALELRARALAALGMRRAAVADLGAAIALDRRPAPDLFLERARLQIAEGDRTGARAGLDDARARLGVVASLELFAIDLKLADGRSAAAGARLEALRAQYHDPAPLAGLAARIASRGGVVAAPAGGAASPGRSTVPAEAAATAGTVLALPRNSMWRYDATGIDLGTAWRQATYDDSAWPSGPGALGYGESYIETTIPFGSSPQHVNRTTYLRTTITVNGPLANIQLLSMTANYDDGFVVYVNGVEAARRGIGTGVITYTTLANSHEGGTYETVELDGAIGALVEGTNVLAVELHQASSNSDDLVWDADLVYSDVVLASLTRGPYLMIGTPDAVTVRWRTDRPTNSAVRFGSSPELLTGIASDAATTTEHVVRVTGLAPATRYYYSVGSSSGVYAGDATFTFVTAPLPGSALPVRAWIIGDSGSPTAEAFAVRDAYAAWTGERGTDLWLMLGDNAYMDGLDDDYQAGVFDQYPLMLRQSVLWPTRGNHDRIYDGPNNDYYDIFSMPAAAEAGGLVSGTQAYYAFDWANIHFVCLDSEGSDRSPGGAMMTWLANDLAANTQPWVIAYWHHPPYSKGSHNSDAESVLRDMRQYALPVLEAGGVDVVLSGHSHSYERSFLLDGHYGSSNTLAPGMVVDGGDGRPGGNGAYHKPGSTHSPHAGAVYAVAGSGSRASGGQLNHPVMVASLNLCGSMALDVHGNQLVARFLDTQGAVLDSFSIVKNGVLGADDGPARPRELELGPGLPNPFTRDLRMSYALEHAGHVRLSVVDAAGRRVATLENGWREAGAHEARWDGRDALGRIVPNGVYVAVLEAHGVRSSRKIAQVR